ncbi:hypothetical protein AACH10_08200 [Ideonella sp. DXS22W]|uniref:Uncharacterized protein n=1 Tax=Pseudaquabacterium inlustre TaxID=2984192 RepID=A0ABU9CEC0_9BURK
MSSPRFLRTPRAPRLPAALTHPMPRLRHAACGLLAATTLLPVLLPGAQAAAPGGERRIRLSLQIEQQREAGIAVIGGSGRQSLNQRLEYALTLVSDGVPATHNPLDPDDTARQLARAQARQQKVDAALARQGGARAGMAAAPDLAALQAQAQQLLARCGQNQDCLMREAAAMQAQMLGGAGPAGAGAGAGRPGGTLSATQTAALQTYAAESRACDKRHPEGAARRACLDDARRRAGGTPDASDHDDDIVPTPYLHFQAPAACEVRAHVRLSDTRRGQTADVQGMRPFEITRQADDTRPPLSECGRQMAVLDTRSGKLWLGSGLPLPAANVAFRYRHGSTVTQQGDEVQNLDWHEATTWLQGRLQQLTRSGSDSVTLPAGPATGSSNGSETRPGTPAQPDGQTRLQLRWTVEGL